MAIKRLTTDKLRSAVTSRDRLSLTIFLAFAFHVILILAINFELPKFHNSALNHMEIINVDKMTDEKVEKPDYVAKHNQKGQGNTSEKVEVLKKLSISSTLNNPGTAPKEEFETSTKATKKGTENALTTKADSDEQINKVAEQDKVQSNVDNDKTQIMNRQQADMALETETNTRKYIRSLDKDPKAKVLEANTIANKDAEYFELWQKRINRFGKEFYTRSRKLRALHGTDRLTGTVVMDVILNKQGRLTGIRVVKASGKPALDRAAKEIVRRAAPFPAIPSHVMGDRSELHIVYAYKFFKKR